MLDQARIEDDPKQAALLEGIVIRPEALAIGGQRLGSRLVPDIVIARHVVQLDRRIEMLGDPPILADLVGIARLIHQVARDHNEGGLQPVRCSDRELKACRLLTEIVIGGLHAELWVGHLKEEEVLPMADCGDGQYSDRGEQAAGDSTNLRHTATSYTALVLIQNYGRLFRDLTDLLAQEFLACGPIWLAIGPQGSRAVAARTQRKGRGRYYTEGTACRPDRWPW